MDGQCKNIEDNAKSIGLQFKVTIEKRRRKSRIDGRKHLKCNIRKKKVDHASPHTVIRADHRK